MGKKLVALNLALILTVGLFFCTLPASATDDESRQAGNYVQGQGVTGESVEDGASVPPAAGGQNASLFAGEPYSISVNGTNFTSDTAMSGTGWNYNNGNGVLQLTNYTGSSITASGDLTIYSNGTVNITGSSGSYGSNAIDVANGTLYFYMLSGTTTITGGMGTEYGGHGIRTPGLYLRSVNSSSNFICSGSYGSLYGGYGISAIDANLSPHNATIIGGGSSSNPGYGILYSNSLYIGVCNMTVEAGGSSTYGIATSSQNSTFGYAYNDLVIVGDKYKYVFTPKVFTLTLNGNGGLYNGNPSWSNSGPYPTFYNLSDYVFTRSGYQQVGWVSGSDFTPIGNSIVPSSNKTLSASWVPMDDDTILYIANGGQINDEHYLVTMDGDSRTPSRAQTINTNASGTDLHLLGWSTRLKMSGDGDYILNNGYQWYLPDTIVSRSGPLTMYAQWTWAGNIIYYDGSGGVDGAGSPVVVQAFLAAGGDRTLHIPDNLGFHRDGYTFTGWENESGEEYLPGRAVSATSDLTVTNLTARWAQNYTLYFHGNGGLDNGMSILTAPTYQGKSQSLSLFNFERDDNSFICWNTKADGSGTDYPASGSVMVTGDLHLYAQWGAVYEGHSDDLRDTVTCHAIPDSGKVNIELSVTSQTDTGTLPVYYALYQGSRLVSVISKNVAVTGDGMSDAATLNYPTGTQPDNCKVFILDTTRYTPLTPPVLCPFDEPIPVFSLTYPKAVNIEADRFNILVKADKAATYYCVLYESGTGRETPSAEQVIAGTDGNDSSSDCWRSVLGPINAKAEGSILFSNFSFSTLYDVFVVAVDALGNKSAMKTFTVQTSSGTAPVWSVYDNRLRLHINTDCLDTAKLAGGLYVCRFTFLNNQGYEWASVSTAVTSDLIDNYFYMAVLPAGTTCIKTRIYERNNADIWDPLQMVPVSVFSKPLNLTMTQPDDPITSIHYDSVTKYYTATRGTPFNSNHLYWLAYRKPNYTPMITQSYMDMSGDEITFMKITDEQMNAFTFVDFFPGVVNVTGEASLTVTLQEGIPVT